MSLMSQNKDTKLTDTWKRHIDKGRAGSSEFWDSLCGHRGQDLEELLINQTGRGHS